MPAPTRQVIGIACDARHRDVEAVLLEVIGLGLGTRVRTLASRTLCDSPASQTAAGSSAPACGRTGMPSGEAIAFCWEPVRRVLEELVRVSRCGTENTLALGLWCVAEPSATAALAARLAECSGITTLSGFASSQLRASRAAGLPYALIDWMTVGSPQRARIVVHMDHTSTIIHLPAGSALEEVQLIEAGPGVGLFERICANWTQTENFRDPRGMLAVQGKQIKPLIRRWAHHPLIRDQGESTDESEEQFIVDTAVWAADQNWSLTDILCTATHLEAGALVDTARRAFPDRPGSEVILVGRGAVNGFLLRLLKEQFTAVGFETTRPGNLASTAYEATTAALLTCLGLDGTPGNIAPARPTDEHRTLGQFTPGAAENWRKCIEWMQMALASRDPLAA